MKKLIFTIATLCLASSSLFASVPVVTNPESGAWPPLAMVAHLIK
jgi:hypothetical protein